MKAISQKKNKTIQVVAALILSWVLMAPTSYGSLWGRLKTRAKNLHLHQKETQKTPINEEKIKGNMQDFDEYYQRAQRKQILENIDKKMMVFEDRLGASDALDFSKDYEEVVLKGKREEPHHVTKAKEFSDFLQKCLTYQTDEERDACFNRYISKAYDYFQEKGFTDPEARELAKKIKDEYEEDNGKSKAQKIGKFLKHHQQLEKSGLETRPQYHYSIAQFYNDVEKFTKKNHFDGVSILSSSVLQDNRYLKCDPLLPFRVKQICKMINQGIYLSKEGDVSWEDLMKYKELFQRVNNHPHIKKYVHVAGEFKKRMMVFSEEKKAKLESGKLVNIDSTFENAYQFVNKMINTNPSLLNKKFEDFFKGIQRGYPYRIPLENISRKRLALGLVIDQVRPHNSSELSAKELKFIQLYLEKCIKKESIDLKACQQVFDPQNPQYSAKNIKNFDQKLRFLLEKEALKKRHHLDMEVMKNSLSLLKKDLTKRKDQYCKRGKDLRKRGSLAASQAIQKVRVEAPKRWAKIKSRLSLLREKIGSKRKKAKKKENLKISRPQFAAPKRVFNGKFYLPLNKVTEMKRTLDDA